MERDLRADRNKKGFPILARTELTEFGASWKSLSRLLLVKGISWAYEKEVRLLVDLKHTRDTGKEDGNGWPVKVIDLPPEAIKEIYRGANTQEADVEQAVQIARGENKKGLFVGRVSSHAFRIQKTGGGTIERHVGCTEGVMILLRRCLAIWSCRPPHSTNFQSTSSERLQASWQALESVLHRPRRHRGRATRVRQGSWRSLP